MDKPVTTPQLGVPDPERRTSPIFGDEDDLDELLDLELETNGCYFNDIKYPAGQYVRSGDELLHCQDRGIWVRKGEQPF